MANLNIKEEKFLFNNDLSEYRNSKQGHALKQAFSTGDKEQIETALKIYYTARNNNNFTYNSEQERIEAIKEDKMFAELLAENN